MTTHTTQLATHARSRQEQDPVKAEVPGGERQKHLKEARRALEVRTQELRQLMRHSQSFDSRTSVEEVMEAQARAKALRWLVQCIEREIHHLTTDERRIVAR